MSEPLSNLDGPCGVCTRPAGDHTLREWSACLGTTTTDIPYSDVPAEAAAAMTDQLRQRFNIGPDVLIADHVDVKSLTIAGRTGTVDVRIPLLLHEFRVGIPDHPPVDVARVAFISSTDSMRYYGRLVRDSAEGAADAAAEGR